MNNMILLYFVRKKDALRKFNVYSIIYLVAKTIKNETVFVFDIVHEILIMFLCWQCLSFLCSRSNIFPGRFGRDYSILSGWRWVCCFLGVEFVVVSLTLSLLLFWGRTAGRGSSTGSPPRLSTRRPCSTRTSSCKSHNTTRTHILFLDFIIKLSTCCQIWCH